MAVLNQNPFDVQTPEHLSSDDFTNLFVEEGSDHYQIMRHGHTFLIGPRGAGKSMIFRLMEPDCLSRNENKQLKNLEFYGAYIPIKDTQIAITELLRLDKLEHAVLILNEHLLVNHMFSRIVRSLIERSGINFDNNQITHELGEFIRNIAVPLVQAASGETEAIDTSVEISKHGDLDILKKVLDQTFTVSLHYLKRLAFAKEAGAYNGPLFGYKDTLEPFIEGLKGLSFMPNGPFYLLLDDADNLNEHQTKILNTWVAARTTGQITIKASVQTGKYKTYQAITGRRIDSPHDFSEVDVTRIYTTDSDKYRSWVEKIVEKRLQKFGVKANPQEFFPPDKKQEEAISQRAEALRKQHDEGGGRGHRRSDDAVRYARPDFIKSLGGKTKSLHSYSYAGFNQLVHISSGVIRHFLEPASLMYSEAQSVQTHNVSFIPDSIQNKQIREYSIKFLFEEFKKHVEGTEGDASVTIDRPLKLKNLINGLGKMFHEVLMSDMSERRKFSIALSNAADKEVQDILDLGVQYGYFHTSTLGSKEGMGRVPLYILSRRLAPMFTLDPSGFSGYQFITNENLWLAMNNPKAFGRRLKEKGLDSLSEPEAQGGLFDDD